MSAERLALAVTRPFSGSGLERVLHPKVDLAMGSHVNELTQGGNRYISTMPNGGTDNCAECRFGVPREVGRVYCTIRALDIGDPYWTYCANHPINNPDGIEVPVGPVYVIGDGHQLQRVPSTPSPEGLVNERLQILERAVRGELDPRSRKLQVAVIEDLAREGVVESVPFLVDLALAESGDLRPAGFAGPDAEAFDLSYTWETDTVRVEFVRLAALRALRQIFNEVSNSDVISQVSGRRDGADLGMLKRINVAIAYVLDYQDPP